MSAAFSPSLKQVLVPPGGIFAITHGYQLHKPGFNMPLLQCWARKQNTLRGNFARLHQLQTARPASSRAVKFRSCIMKSPYFFLLIFIVLGCGWYSHVFSEKGKVAVQAPIIYNR
jgi:hypothetical protein